MVALFAALSRLSTVMCVTTAPEIAMSLGTQATAAGNGPRGNCALHSTVKAGPRMHQSAGAGRGPFASPVA
jgi:hypothetical protein